MIFVITVRISPASLPLHKINHRNADILLRSNYVHYYPCRPHLFTALPLFIFAKVEREGALCVWWFVVLFNHQVLTNTNLSPLVIKAKRKTGFQKCHYLCACTYSQAWL